MGVTVALRSSSVKGMVPAKHVGQSTTCRSGAGRVQTNCYRITNATLVGMTPKELQKAFKIRIYENAVTGATTVFSMPQDIIDSTRRAFNTDPMAASRSTVVTATRRTSTSTGCSSRASTCASRSRSRS